MEEGRALLPVITSHQSGILHTHTHTHIAGGHNRATTLPFIINIWIKRVTFREERTHMNVAERKERERDGDNE